MAPFFRLTWRVCFRSISDLEAASHDRLLRVDSRKLQIQKADVATNVGLLWLTTATDGQELPVEIALQFE